MSTVVTESPAQGSSTTLSNGIRTLSNYSGGKWVESRTSTYLPVTNPSIGKQIASVPLSTSQDVDDAVDEAQTVCPLWSSMPIKERVQVLFRYKTLMEKHGRDLAAL